MMLSTSMLLAACGSTPSLSTSIVATGLDLTPGTAQVDTAATLQFHATVAWSDNQGRTTGVTFTSTGGSISPSGLFTAGQVPGAYEVIATCTCGVADTAQVTIIAPTVVSPDLERGSLALAIAGLPAGANAQVTVQGPGGYRRVVGATAQLDSLVPGDYQVSAGSVVVADAVFVPATTSHTVTVAAGQAPTVTVQFARAAPAGLPAHPRVWMNPARVTALRAEAATGSSRWLRVKGWADGQVAKGAAYTSGDDSYLTALCASYLATGQQAYADRAGVILTQTAVPSHDLHEDSGYYIRSGLPLISAALDWCYDGLSPAVRRQAASWLMDRSDWVWPETNPDRSGRYALDRATDNYWWGYMMTGPAALAAAGDDTVATRDRPAEHMAIALAKWNHEGSDALTEQAGGMWIEGTNYDSSNRVGTFTDAFLTSGIPLTHPFLRESLLFRIHSTMPGGQYKVPIGDQARVSDAPLFAYDRGMALAVLPSSEADATLAGQVKSWLDWIGEESTRNGALTPTSVDEFLRYNPNAASAPIATLPLDYTASGTGTFIYRTSWTDPSATAFVFQSGNSSETHSDQASNQLLIWKGAYWISVSANLYSHSGIRHETEYHNTLTVGPYQQHQASEHSELLGQGVSGNLVWIRGQAQPSYRQYGSTPNPLTDYVRTVAYLPTSDAFVVVDQVTAKDANLPKVVRWHAHAAPVINGKSFVLRDSGPYQCSGEILAPAAATVTSQSFQLGTTVGSGAVTSSAVAVSASGQASEVFVTVLQCGSGAAVQPSQLTQTAGSVVVQVAGHVVTVPLDRVSAVLVQ